MLVRIITKESCPKCKSYLQRLDAQGFQYFKYDADADANQKQLDEWKVDEIPVVQVLSADQTKVLHQFAPGTFSPRAINYKIKELEKLT